MSETLGNDNQVLEIAKDVYKCLGRGLHECIYQKAMAAGLRDTSVKYQTEVTIPIYYREWQVGVGRADILVLGTGDAYPDSSFIIELKAVRTAIGPNETTQILNYLRHIGNGINRGLIINFPQTDSAEEIQYKWVTVLDK